MRTFQIISGLFAVYLLTGCKLAVIAGEGGSVSSASGLRDCPRQTYCVNQITDPDFTESFTAIAHPGYEFVQWQGGTGFMCAESTDPTCMLSISGSPVAEEVVASYELGYLMPVFRDVGIDSDGDGQVNRVDEDDDNDGLLDIDDPCPLDPDIHCIAGAAITDTMIADGKEWAQPELFVGLTWEEIDAACPGGDCLTSASLNGYELAGWKWAVAADFLSLFEWHFERQLSLTSQIEIFSDTSWEGFLAAGWRLTYGDSNEGNVAGLLQDLAPDRQAGVGRLGGIPAGFIDIRHIGGPPGSWFYRPID